MMEAAILILLTSLSNCLCVAVGLAVGQKIAGHSVSYTLKEKPVSRKEAKAIREEQKKQQETFAALQHNIDVYDGTDNGQKYISE